MDDTPKSFQIHYMQESLVVAFDSIAKMFNLSRKELIKLIVENKDEIVKVLRKGIIEKARQSKEG